MKTSVIALAGIIAIYTAPAFAMLSPYWDSAKKIEAVLSSEVSTKVVGSVTAVKDLGGLHFEVDSQHCQVFATLEAHIPSMPGATSYTLHSIDQVRCQ